MKSPPNITKPKNIRVDSIQIGLTSPERIRDWAERILPNGKLVGHVTSSQTVNYKTLKPEKGGLFCERIFGPVKDYECACGRKRNRWPQKFCPDCDVEFTLSEVRRYRLGYIHLISPVTHVWYLRGIPSYIPILLNLPKKRVEAITYCTETLKVFDLKTPYREKSTSWWHRPLKSPKIYNLSVKKEEPRAVPFSRTSVVPVAATRDTELVRIDSSNLPKASIWLSETNPRNHTVNLFYSITQQCSWETQDHWNYFFYYMSGSTNQHDIPIPEYSTRTVFHPFENYSLLERNRDYSSTGGEAIQTLLASLDVSLLDRHLRFELFELRERIVDLESKRFLLLIEQKRLRALLAMRAKKIRRLKLVRNLRLGKIKPEWMVLSILPVLPPDLRPIIQLDGDQVAVSDLNKLYQKVLFRNNRLKRQKRNNYSNKSDEMKYGQRLLQEAVDALIENGKGGAEPICASNDRPLKSLSDILKGKKGRFRQNLLGKRVDYSGRSVIVVGPKLKIHECGLPKEMAIELFQPFLIRKLMTNKIVRTIVGAKRLIHEQDSVIWEILQQVMENHPVLLNRAPTLHRLGIQAFQAKLVGGRAILLHPLVCPSFNADFDGDQMAVHVPLSFEARAEAWKLMWSRNNLLSPATGQPILIPSQDMVLGCYFLTTNKSILQRGAGKYFADFDDVLKGHYQKRIELHAYVWVRCNENFESPKKLEKPIELRVSSSGNFSKIYANYSRSYDSKNNLVNKYIRTTPGRILLNKVLITSLKA